MSMWFVIKRSKETAHKTSCVAVNAFAKYNYSQGNISSTRKSTHNTNRFDNIIIVYIRKF